ncbi:anti-CBASS protein Acb1 family protein [Lysinibacillus sp. NPDC047702]|uniref:anti-CBASS protein Acb1 family protein n=1 Tax=unclassified Lysinibacillus TaxID=2636778 RepID=UPI003D014574
MSLLEQARQYKEDFMQGHGKASAKDKLTRQVPGVRRKLTHAEISGLYADNPIVQNIVDIPAEDMTRHWFTLRMKDEQLARDIMGRLADLKAKEAFKNMRMYERMRGDGFISLGVTQKSKFDLQDPLKLENLKSVDYLHPFSSMKVSELLINDDVFDNNYGKLENLRINRASRSGIQAVETESLVHYSRVLHDQTRRLEDEEQGMSLLETLYDAITVLDTSLWSVGQILHDFTFKVYQSKDVENLTKEDKRELSMIMDFMFRTEALAIIRAEETLTKQTTPVSGLKDLLDFVWEYIAASARMPKSVIKGQEAGTLTGAQYDVMNYYARITSAQENEQKPLLEQLIRMLLWAENEPGGRIDPDKLEWEIKFNPLWSVDWKTDAEIRKIVAETDQIYISNGVIADQLKLAVKTETNPFGEISKEQYKEITGQEFKTQVEA